MKINFDEVDIFSLGQTRLTQAKFKEGILIVAGVRAKDVSIAIDVRFYFEKGGTWMPTKKGFWVEQKNWAVLEKVLSMPPEIINDLVCWGNKDRKFIVRFMPNHGGGVDFRYYSESSKYVGWEKKGIRFVLSDYFNVKVLILDAIRDLENGVVGDRANLIKNDRCIGRKKRYVKKKTSVVKQTKKINPELMTILEI